MKANLHLYQAVVVFPPKIEDKDRDKVFKKLEQSLEVYNAKIEKKDHVGPKDLVYEVAGGRKGDFWILDIESIKPVKLTEINLTLNREANVIRYLILRK